MNTLNTLTIDDITRFAPSAAATEPMTGASNAYSFVSTIDAIELIMGAGWKPYRATECKVRSEEKKGYQRHLIRFSMGEMLNEVGQERIDLLLFNSHDRGSSFRLAMGIFRLVCENGLVVGDESLSFRHKHIGFNQDAFLKSVNYIADNGRKIGEKVNDFKTIELTRQESGIYAAAAAQLISDEGVNEIDNYTLTRPRRNEDRTNDLWTTYNRVQENIMKGGIARHGRTETGRRKKRTRKVNSIDKDIKLNKALWLITEKMAELKMEKAA